MSGLAKLIKKDFNSAEPTMAARDKNTFILTCGRKLLKQGVQMSHIIVFELDGLGFAHPEAVTNRGVGIFIIQYEVVP